MPRTAYNQKSHFFYALVLGQQSLIALKTQNIYESVSIYLKTNKSFVNSNLLL